ncbi:NADP-dependent oxidoreductase [Nonomuraea sp. bgisy101]|uniref:NADP-dependent oxidoreductase n=1 Tax=Nonomuraea sp. bgisy101 TaxID=3413784 RepID=UPI003D70BF30
MMNAARFTQYGSPDVIELHRVPIPTPGPGEVLIKVAATSFNPTETALRSGMLRTVFPLALPYTLGWDVAGTVVDGASGWAEGDQVIGRLDAGGTAAEYVIARADVLAPAPTSIPLTQAAAIPVAGLTAWQAVHEHVKVTPGQRVLINGAGGGIGGFTVQLAKLAGAFVVATASARSAVAITAQGADQIVDYTAEPLPGGMDAVINLAPISPESAAGLAELVRPGGSAVSVATPIPAYPHFVTRNDPAQLRELVALIDAGDLSLDIAQTLPLSDLPAVHARSEAGQTRGKIILIP